MKKVTIVVTENTTLKELLAMLGTVDRNGKMPTARALRERKQEDGTVKKIRPLAETPDGGCRVYENGYAVYSNGCGTTVLWLPDCCSFTYQFGELSDDEKHYMPQRNVIGAEILGEQPWYIAVTLRGDHQVERNNMNRQYDRKGANKELSHPEAPAVWI